MGSGEESLVSVKRMPLMVVIGLSLLPLSAAAADAPRSFVPAGYTGVPFGDARHPAAPQRIPGRLQCELYDVGGPGVAYHDSDAKNSGSGALNPLDGTYVNSFR